MDRAPGLSVRLKLTLSYAGLVMLAGALLLAVVWVFLLRYVPDVLVGGPGPRFPDRSDLLDAFVPKAALMLAFLLAFSLVGGWLLAGQMLAPLTRVTNAARMTATGSLSHRIQLEGRRDEFRELADAFDSMLARLEAQVAEQQRFAANASHEREHEQERQHDGRHRSERVQEVGAGGTEAAGNEAAGSSDDLTVGYVAQEEHPHDGEQQRAGDHQEAGVAEGELEANAQTGGSIHGRLPRDPCRCGSRRRPRWR